MTDMDINKHVTIGKYLAAKEENTRLREENKEMLAALEALLPKGGEYQGWWCDSCQQITIAKEDLSCEECGYDVEACEPSEEDVVFAKKAIAKAKGEAQ